MAKPFKRLLLTGAAGGLGKILRERIKPWADVVVLSDIADMGEAGEGEEIVQCDLADKAAVMKLMEGVEAVLHFGGISTENTFENIMQANILGTANLYEAAHKKGVKRIIFASSNHTVGFYRNTDYIDATAPTRPDSFYGVSKCFGEQLASYYYDRVGLETVCLRIGSSFPEPVDRRMMVTWLSYDDLVEALHRSLFATRVGFTILFGMSNNDVAWWDNSKASHLGYKPKDSSSQFDGKFPDSGEYPDRNASVTYHGGGFALAEIRYKD
ncbi:NAD-dependent epimerase/dehydratase family protein [Duganella sp. PWIR1]|jgi:uronate dehydrogenase